MNRTFTFIAAVIILAFIAAFAIAKFGAAPSPASGIPSGENAISIGTEPAGNSVKVSSVSLSEPGFVVIHESENGQPGRIIASSSLIPAGVSNDVVIPLPSPSNIGDTYIAELHFDDGDGSFDWVSDPPVRQGGGVVMAEFLVN